MAKYLVVVESPAKAKTIKKFLGSNYVIRACFGAVRDLPKSQIGVDVENNFEPKYVNLREERARDAIKEIRERAAKADHVLLASDPDREGEAIAWHVQEILKSNKKTREKPTSRIVFNEITKQNVKEAVKSPREIDYDLVDAQQARRIVDRLVGYKISPLLSFTRKKRGLSAGRVQSVALRMVVNKEEEIRAFQSEEYWTIEADLQTERKEKFRGRLHKRGGETVKLGEAGHIPDEATATAIVSALENSDFTIEKVERKEVKRRPKPPFITSTLQQEASRKLGMSTARTMAIAQQLYQGIALGDEGPVGLITYMRTDSTRLSGQALNDARGYIGSRYETPMLPEKPNFYSNKKQAQDAHEAIRPTSANRTPESLRSVLSEAQYKVYDLIWKRFISSQMAPAIFDQTLVVVQAGEHELRANGSIVKFQGFTALYQESSDDRSKDDRDRLLPDVAEGESASLEKLFPEQHFTQPPPRYTEASLVAAMEKNGIGRPSTYAPTIKTILDRLYVEKERGRLSPTQLGEETNAWLVDHFPDILSIDFTARLEERLDEVEEGKEDWHDVARDFYGPFEKDLSQTQKRMVAEMVGDDPKCPECGAPAVLKESWFGLYIGCTRHPDCKGIVKIERDRAPAEPTDEVCTECGKPMVIRTGRYGKFMACSGYPECKHVINLDKDGNKLPPKPKPRETGIDCPDCKKGQLLIRTSRKGEEFYGCSAYPKCRFTKPMELNLPCPQDGCEGQLEHQRIKRRRAIGCDKCKTMLFGQADKDHACPTCGTNWTLVTKPRGKPRQWSCPKESCEYVEEMPEE